MQIQQIISVHKKRKGREKSHYTKPKTGFDRAMVVLYGKTRGYHTRHMNIPKGFHPSSHHTVESVERAGGGYELIVQV